MGAVLPPAYPGQPLHDRLTSAERDELGPFLLWRTCRGRARQQYGQWLETMCAQADADALHRQRQEWGQLAGYSPLSHRWTHAEAKAAALKSALNRAQKKKAETLSSPGPSFRFRSS
jgi:hypothetical protein